MSLLVNFTTYGRELMTAYQSILKPTDPSGDNWAMFGYDKGTNDLKVLGTGSGGLEELEDEFSEGKIQYAFVRIIDPNSELNKFILIAWCGDGVPESKKGLFNSHLADVAKFLKGYHLQINARCDADVTPAQILKRVDEGSGSKYSFHKETVQKQEGIRPLQSAYKKTEIPDIASLQKNPTKPEPAPKYSVGARTFGSPASNTASSPPPTAAKKPLWETPAATPSTPPQAERSWKSSSPSVTSSYVPASATSFNKVAPPSSLSSYNSAPEPPVNKAHQMRLEREAREKEERAMIEREIRAREEREAKNRTGSSVGPSSSSSSDASAVPRSGGVAAAAAAFGGGGLSSSSSSSFGGSSSNNAFAQRKEEERRAKEQRENEQRENEDRIRRERAAKEQEEREAAAAEDERRAAQEASRAKAEFQARDQADRAERERELREREEEQARKKEADQQRRREQEEAEAAEEAARREEQEREEYERQEREHAEAQEAERQEAERQRQAAELEEEERHLQEVAAAASSRSTAAASEALVESMSAPETAGSVSAVVLYSYDKAEANEMSLIEGEIIINVTELDVGWWGGESEDGTRSGLFPANYVEVIEREAAAPAPVAHEDYAAEPTYEEAASHHEEVPPAGHGETAVALYEYVEGEPNEISFAEGEIITEIERVTEDWWSGKNSKGNVGLFPANYVEAHQ